MNKQFIIIFILLLSIRSGAQQITIKTTTYKIVSIDPNSKRLFISYFSKFNNAPVSDSAIIKDIIPLRDTLKRYVECLFKLENISFFANSQYAKYVPIDRRENLEWSRQYLGELDLIREEYYTFPALKKKSQTIKVK